MLSWWDAVTQMVHMIKHNGQNMLSGTPNITTPLMLGKFTPIPRALVAITRQILPLGDIKSDKTLSLISWGLLE